MSTIVAPKSVGSSTTKGQMNPTFRASLTASQAGENSQINAPEHTNVSSILTFLTFRRNQGRRTAPSGPTIESAKQPTSSNEFQNSNSTQSRPRRAVDPLGDADPLGDEREPSACIHKESMFALAHSR